MPITSLGRSFPQIELGRDRDQETEKWITNLRFADITLTGKSVEELNLILVELMKECRKAGLEISVSKTKLMLREEGIKSIWVNQAEVENVDK